ncbi:ankyrin repeat ph and sec7 domain containing protein secg-related [Anaeramoeba ignava]|uniref:Ankyrin repeat ph and sec7 domain containing protein secg-related n=1 Tax=Anaeramoeba ignava TaxID=1746090 RepID=A0A9Q0RHQ8_ANAIG|nr:ankyrin repeat ph and sec7 domain containing protein secg-related [Anaeramoeba ignava]
MESTQKIFRNIDFEFVQFALSLNQNDAQKTIEFISNEKNSEKVFQLIDSLKNKEKEKEILVKDIIQSIENKDVNQVEKYITIWKKIKGIQMIDAFDYNSLLHIACLKNSGLEIIKLLIGSGADVNFMNDNKQNVLHVACKNGNSMDIIKLLLEKKPLITKDKFGSTPLIWALSKNPNYEIIDLLLKYGEDPKIRFQKMSLFFLAIKNQADHKTLKILLDHGLDPKEIFQDKTAIDFAILHQSSLEVIQFLHQNGVDVKRKSKAGFNCLYFLLVKKVNSPEICDFLISVGIDILEEKNTLLEVALEKGVGNSVLEVMVSKITKQQLERYTEKKKGNPLLNIALEHQRKYGIIKSLIELGCLVNEKNYRGKTSLYFAIEKKADLNTIKLLIDSGANIKETEEKTEKKKGLRLPSILTTAIAHSREVEVIKLLTDSGVQIEDQNLVAAFKKDMKVFLHLLSIKTDFSFESNLSMIISFDCDLDFDKIKFLADHMKDINYKSDYQNTILHLLCKTPYISPEILEYLISKGVDLNAVNEQGNLPFFYLFGFRKRVPEEKIEKLIKSYLINKISWIDAPLGCWKKMLPKFEFVDPLSPKMRSPVDERYMTLRTEADSYDKEYMDGTRELLQLLKHYTSFSDDFNKLFKSGLFPDLEIKFADEEIAQVHKLIISARIGKEKLEEFIEFCKKKTKKDLKFLFQWIYSGYIADFDFEEELFADYEKFCGENKNDSYVIYERYDKVVEILENERKNNLNSILDNLNEIGVLKTKEELIKKTQSDGLRKDISKLFYEDETKDFKIICEDEEIKVHKLILIARSELFYGMFLNVNDDSNQVNDYSGKKKQSIKEFIKFLYFDKIDMNISEEIIEEFYDFDKYYQLNEKSVFPLLLEDLKRQRNLN